MTQAPPIRESDGSWDRSNKQKADAFDDHLENIENTPCIFKMKRRLPVYPNRKEHTLYI